MSKKNHVLLWVVLCAFFFNMVMLSSCGKQDPPYDERKLNTYIEPNKKELPTPEEFSDVKEGMTFTEVVELVGRPQREIGSGAVIYEFDLSDGSTYAVYFITDQEHRYVVSGIMKPTNK